MKQDYQIQRLDFSNTDDMNKLVLLQNIVYVGKHKFESQTFQHWYLDNPNGHVVSFNALYEDTIVAHYALIPVKMEIEGHVISGLLSMATVTHPAHRGKGLFVKLAKLTYDYAKQDGFKFVIGVANANSFPGFIKHLSFQHIGQLDVMIGCSKNIIENGVKIFKMHWDKDSIQWRFNDNRYSKGSSSVFGTKAFWKFKKAPLVNTYMGYVQKKLLDELSIPNVKSIWRPFNLYVGIGSNAREIGYHDIPKFIKRSPFHLIFLDLTEGKLPQMTKDNVFFQLMDFDVA